MNIDTNKTRPFVGRLACPLGRGRECLGIRCALWSDDWKACSLSCDAIHNAVRTAITDAAVEIIKCYRTEAYE